ncbi:unnamed protein product [Chondrus crispus]|uniref:Uncharacterized protein n=1 Tax=Chondrus crispus TaxID=2769 RepID=R7QSV4_CHOCR|nr:unnamed protein product [Chondrus crispus]CDF40455.1 unnamed protein product [Chondrus crispus]|eukprot:XP_005710749.1 unnamed protein product [Chondrus crispus]
MTVSSATCSDSASIDAKAASSVSALAKLVPPSPPPPPKREDNASWPPHEELLDKSLLEFVLVDGTVPSWLFRPSREPLASDKFRSEVRISNFFQAASKLASSLAFLNATLSKLGCTLLSPPSSTAS